MRLQSQGKLPIFPQRGKRLSAFARALKSIIRESTKDCLIVIGQRTGNPQKCQRESFRQII